MTLGPKKTPLSSSGQWSVITNSPKPAVNGSGQRPSVTIEHRGQLLFHVTSESREEEFYVCDLSLHKGRGQCTCRDWETRCQPRIKEGKMSEYPQTDRDRCKHIHACVLWLGNEVIRRTIG